MLPAGTVSDDVLSATEWGEPAWLVAATANVAGEEPLLTTLITFVFEKLAFGSSKPKFTETSKSPPKPPAALAITSVAVDLAGWTRPVLPRLIR